MYSGGGCASGPDVRWQSITVGDLLGHSSGLRGAFSEWSTTIQNTEATRGYASKADWDAEHADFMARTHYPTEAATARAYVADLLGVPDSDVIFLNAYPASTDDNPGDEILRDSARRCMSATPAGQSDSNPSGSITYENQAYFVLERIASHLNGENGGSGLFSSPGGFPELHEGSVLDDLLLSLDIDEGIIAEHSLQSRVSGFAPGQVDPVPERRDYDADADTYTLVAPSVNRPFCVWDGSTCDTDPWWNDGDNTIGLRIPWDFTLGELTEEDGWFSYAPPPSVRVHYNTPGLTSGTGGLMAEMPAFLRILDKYWVNDFDVHQGLLRQGCTNCTAWGDKNGLLNGSDAFAASTSAPVPFTRPVPPRDSNGWLTREPDTDQWTSPGFNLPSGIDFAVAAAQSSDEQSSGYNPETFAVYGLSRVDWDAVDAEIAASSQRVVGMSVNDDANTYRWFADGHREIRDGVPNALGALLSSATGIDLPSTREGEDIVGMAISTDEKVYTWYSDGHRSVGNSLDLDSSTGQPIVRYSLPPGQAYEDIVALAINSDNRVYSWYSDGSRAIGTSYDLDYYGTGSFTVPPGQTPDEIVGIAIDRNNGDGVYAEFRDGSTARGRTWELDMFDYDRGNIAAMSMSEGDTTMWYANGYRRRMEGSPADNQDTPTILERGAFVLPAGYEASDVIGVAEIGSNGHRFWFDDGTSSWNDDGAVAVDWHDWPNMSSGHLSGIARASNGTVYSWYDSGRRTVGTASDVASTGTSAAYDAAQHPFNIAAVAIDSGSGGDGYVWTIYHDGTVSRGRSWDLGQTVWPAP